MSQNLLYAVQAQVWRSYILKMITALVTIFPTLTISIYLVDHILQFCFCWILTQRPHDSSQFFCCDSTITIFVK